ncbi:spore wall protein 7 (SWP7) [Vairimorpha necatrix]|uniref:Spore wall protein 7 (SWP7) n=1 Tax=Vairimorpha necatrix TaxID=6039 RepID=A0AAX4J8L8_9MICR
MIKIIIFQLVWNSYIRARYDDTRGDDFIQHNSVGSDIFEDEYGLFPDYALTKKDSEPMDDELRCAKSDQTFIVSLNVHLQKYAVESIESASKSKLNMILPEREAVLSYLGTIVNEMNSDLIRFGVQIVLHITRYKTENFIVTDSFDSSCEIKDPISDRLDESHNQLKDLYQDNMGLHLFVWTCPQDNKDFLTIKINENERCGRTIGALWQGIDLTRINIKSSIIEAITGVPNLYLDGNFPAKEVFSNVCKFVGDCIGAEPGVVGWKNQALVQVIHAIPDNSAHD